jgi:hypothetical protein
MIYELRVYDVAPGRMGDLHKRFREHTLGLFKRHDITPVGFFTSEIGGATDQLTYILSFKDLGHRESAWEAFQRDPEWQSVKAASEEPGPLVMRIRNSILAPTDYSALA